MRAGLLRWGIWLTLALGALGLLATGIWLALTLGASPKTDTLTGVSGAIRFTPPKGYCVPATNDTTYAALQASLQADLKKNAPTFTVQRFMVDCDSAAAHAPTPQSYGYVAFVAGGDVADANRFAWLSGQNGKLPTGQSDGQGAAGLNSAVLYVRNVTVDTPVAIDAAAAPAPETITLAMDAETITHNTVVDIGLRRIVGSGDAVGLSTTLIGFRKTLGEELDQFSKANGYAVTSAPSSDDATSAEWLLACGGVIGLGIVLQIAITIRSILAGVLLCVALAVGGDLVARAAPASPLLGMGPFVAIFMWVALALAAFFIAKGVLSLLSRIRVGPLNLTEHLRHAMLTHFWSGANDAPPLNAGLTKRLFVTVSAATGSVVASLIVQPGFSDQFLHAFDLTRIVFTLLIMLVSFTLIGPVEEYIFESRIVMREVGPHHLEPHHRGEGSRFERLITLTTPRAIGRLLMVLLLALLLTGVDGALESRIRDGDATASLFMIVASMGPAVVTYYWCASLQRGVASVAGQAGRAAGLAGVVLVGAPAALTFCLLAFLATVMPPSGDEYRDTYLILALASLPFGGLTFGLLAFFGGCVIDFAQRRGLSPVVSTALIGVVLFDCIGVYLAGWNWVYLVMLHNLDSFGKSDMTNTVSTMLAALGWAFGLLVSGFPEVLRLCRGFTLPAKRTAGPAPKPEAVRAGP